MGLFLNVIIYKLVNMKKEYKIVLILLALALIIRILFFLAVPIIVWDETVYLNLGYDLSKNPLDYSFHNWADYISDNSWPRAGFRPPLLPYIISIFYFLKLPFLIGFIMPILGSLTVLVIYFLGKKLFNKKVGLYSAILLAFTPTHAYLSGRVLNDVLVTFFIALSFLFFWKGFEENNRSSKIAFGFIMALALLSKYTTLWIFPIFLLYFLVRDRSFKFFKDKYLWIGIFVFFLVLIPWFISSFFEYGNIFGAFLHGFKSAFYWGGVQPWFFYFIESGVMLSILAIIFPLAIIYIIFKKYFVKKEIYFLLILLGLFLIIAMFMPHKEDRFILPIVPVICLLSGFFITKIHMSNKIIILFLIILAVPLIFLPSLMNYYVYSFDRGNCLSQTATFLKNSSVEVIITEGPPIVYYYTKKTSYFFPPTVDSEIFKEGIKDKNTVFLFFTAPHLTNNPLLTQIKERFDKNETRLFECGGIFYIYQLKNPGKNISLVDKV